MARARKRSSRTEGRRSSRSLVVQRMENISKSIFKRYHSQITDLIGGSHGIYALYDDKELYYVGKSTDLRRRVRAHLRDKHLASWTHFSLYLVRKADHLDEIESILVRIANPRGNRVAPRGRSGSTLLRELRSLVKQTQLEELENLFGPSARSRRRLKKSPKRKEGRGSKSLDGLVTRRTPLYRTYKGKEYKAFLLSSGKISFGGKRFTSPSAAAMAVTHRAANGWRFWYIKDTNGEWVHLGDYRP